MMQSYIMHEALMRNHVNAVTFGTLICEKSDTQGFKQCELTDFEALFFNRSYRTLAFTANSDDRITSIVFQLEGKMDSEFYRLIVEELGTAERILKKGTILSASEEEHNGVKAKSTKSRLVPCLFEDKPDMIIWKRRYGELRLVMNPYTDVIHVNLNQVKFVD